MSKKFRKDFCDLSARQKRRRVLQTIQSETENSESYATSNLNCNDKLNDQPSSSNVAIINGLEVVSGSMTTAGSNLILSNSVSSILTDSFLNNDESQPTETVNEPMVHIIEETVEPITKSDKNIFRNKLRDLFIAHNISRCFANELLTLLKDNGHSDLPKDVRVLLQTPKKGTDLISNLMFGKYAHFGVEGGLRRSVEMHWQVPPDKVYLDFNIDGLPLAHSSGSQFWPILGSVVSETYTQPFVVGIYHELKKPQDCNEFLQLFVHDMKRMQQNGIIIKNKKINVFIRAFICDAPAKAFITCVKNHTGYFACSKCCVEGDFVKNRVTFSNLTSPLRTDDSFANKHQPEHHHSTSILETLNIGMVSQFPIDYMHLVCLGVMKRLLKFWIFGKMNVRLKATEIEVACKRMQSLKVCISKEFARKPRSLLDIDRWKATEFRQFLLYTGYMVVKDLLPKKLYIHFLCLSVAMRILSTKDYKHLLPYAQELFIFFVNKFGDYYGEEYISYNIHNLIHLCADVTKFGTVDSFSAFKYENYMYQLKKKLKPGRKPLEQICNRLTEINKLPVTYQDVKYPMLILKKNEIIGIKYNSFSLYTTLYNNCCILKNNEIGIINNIKIVNREIYVEIKLFMELKRYFESPCPSTDLNIGMVKDLGDSVVLNANVIIGKCLLIDISDGIDCRRVFRDSHGNEFAVVYFCSDKTTSEIPVSWLTDNGSACWWPPTRYASSYIVNKYAPDPQTWSKHAVKVEVYCASLKLARKKADDLNCTTEDDTEQRGRGRRKKINIVHEGATSDSETDDPHDIPPQIHNHRQVSSLRTDFNLTDIPIVIDNSATYPQVVENEIAPMYAVSESSGKNQEYASNHELKDSIDLLIKQVTELQQQLQQVLLYQKSIDRRLSNIEQNKHQLNATGDNSALMAVLPINSIDKVHEFEGLLTNNEEIRDTFKSYISSIGGKSPRDNVYRVFAKTFTNNLANLSSWLGQRNNFRVCDLQTIKIIKDAVMPVFNIKENEFEAIGKEWFRLAKNRIIQANKKKH